MPEGTFKKKVFLTSFGRYLPTITPKGWKQKAELTLHFLKRKQQEYESLKREWEGLSPATGRGLESTDHHFTEIK